MRRERDSNPRYPYEYNTLAGCRFQPLSHLSKSLNLHQENYEADRKDTSLSFKVFKP